MWVGCFIRCCCWCPGVRHHGQTAPVGPQWHQRDWGLLPEAPLCCCMQPKRLSAPPAAESPVHSGLQACGEGERMQALPWGRTQHPHPHATVLILLSSQHTTHICPVGHTALWLRPQISDPVPLLNHSSQFSGYCSYLEAAPFIGALADFLWGTTISVIIRERETKQEGVCSNSCWLSFLSKNKLRYKSYI